MIDLIFDTETTKFPQWKLPDDHPDQTQLMQLGILMVKGDEVILEWDHLVYCTQEPAEGAYNAHQISLSMCQEAGVRLRDAVDFFDKRLKDVDRVVCHNVAFDFKIMACAYAQVNKQIVEAASVDDEEIPGYDINNLIRMPNICTMLSATDVLKIRGKIPNQWKWPTLQEAYRSLVDPEGFEGAHSAGADCEACHKVLVALTRQGVELKGKY